MDNLEIEVLTAFDESSLFDAYDISELKLSLAILAEKSSYKHIAMGITLSVYSYDDDDDESETFLVSSDFQEQLKSINDQVDYPLVVAERANLELSVSLANPNHPTGNLLDSMKGFPQYILDAEEVFDLCVWVALTREDGEQIEKTATVSLKNPWKS